jgi:hypothetical protein
MSLTNYRQEAIKLYRDILRASRHFTWNNDQGVPWAEILRKNARKEFEASRYERDPVLITRMLFVGRDCLNQTMEKVAATAKKIEENIDRTRTR